MPKFAIPKKVVFVFTSSAQSKVGFFAKKKVVSVCNLIVVEYTTHTAIQELWYSANERDKWLAFLFFFFSKTFVRPFSTLPTCYFAACLILLSESRSFMYVAKESNKGPQARKDI